MKFKSLFNRLGAHLALWFCFSSILLTLFLSQVIEEVAARSLRAEIGQRLADLALQTTDKLDRGMFERYREVQLMSDRREIGDPAVSDSDKQRLLDHMQETYQYYAWIGIADLNGKILASSKGILQGADVSKRPWFPNALRGVHIDDVHEGKMLASLLPKSATGEPIRFVDVAFPFAAPDGTVAGVLGAHLSWTWARAIEQSVITSSARRNHIEAMIVGSDGTILLGPPTLQGTVLKDVRSRYKGTDEGNYVIETWPDKKDYLVGFSASHGHESFAGFGWTVLVRQQTAEAFAPVRMIQRRLLWSGFGIALLFSLLGVVNARRISQPLEALARAANRLRHGEAVDIDAIDGKYREISALAASFNSLVHELQHNQTALQELNTSLELRVLQRTEELLRSEKRLRTITDNLPVLISYLDQQQRFTFVNETFRDWLGIAPEEAIGRTVESVVGPAMFRQRQSYIERALAGERVTFDVSSEAQGLVRQLHTTFIPDIAADGTVNGVYGLSTDVSAMKIVEQKLSRLARHDNLTGLANRFQIGEKLEDALHRCRRTGAPLAVLFMDIDHFKRINDTKGHSAGDDVLKEFSRRLMAAVRVTDTVGRLAGDEFIVVLEAIHDVAEAETIAAKILTSIGKVFRIGDALIEVTTSIGIAISLDGTISQKALLAQADKALYASKGAGRNRFSVAEAG